MQCNSCRDNGSLTQILLEIKEDTGAMKASIASLSGPQGRVTALEKAADRQFWYTVGIVPILAAIHAGLRKMGVEL